MNNKKDIQLLANKLLDQNGVKLIASLLLMHKKEIIRHNKKDGTFLPIAEIIRMDPILLIKIIIKEGTFNPNFGHGCPQNKSFWNDKVLMLLDYSEPEKLESLIANNNYEDPFLQKIDLRVEFKNPRNLQYFL